MKRSFDELGVDMLATVKRARVPIQGPAFSTGIAAIRDETSAPVHTQVDVPIQFRKNHVTKPFNLELEATFSAKGHKDWVQGWMDMVGETSYEKILPAKLGLKQATVESRVMKSLALGAAYVPKNDLLIRKFDMVDRTVKGKPFTPVWNAGGARGPEDDERAMRAATHNWGRTAIQSSVEDITGRTALGITQVGSGMRALTLASKLRMKTTGTQSDAGFKQKMEKRFPQILTKQTGGGAKHYNDIIAGELSTGSHATQNALSKQVRKAHFEVNRESRNRFNHKWGEIKAGRMTTDEAGAWWVNKFGSGGMVTGHRKRIRAQYITNKLARHDIVMWGGRRTG